jgi:hypothetical protein
MGSTEITVMYLFGLAVLFALWWAVDRSNNND